MIYKIMVRVRVRGRGDEIDNNNENNDIIMLIIVFTIIGTVITVLNNEVSSGQRRSTTYVAVCEPTTQRRNMLWPARGTFLRQLRTGGLWPGGGKRR